MSAKDKINAKYLALHDALGSRRDAPDKELFDQQHRQVWADCDIELRARKVKLEAQTTLTPTEKQEFDELESIFPKPASSARNLADEIDELKALIKINKHEGLQ